jgi:hypothetical protein
MAAIEVIVFTVAAGFMFAVAITIIVIIGIRQEERYLTLTDRTAPGAIAQLARIVVCRYVRREQDSTVERRPPDDSSGAREATTSSRR